MNYNIWLTLCVIEHLFIYSPWKPMECSRIFYWQNTIEPSMTHPATRCIILLYDLQKKMGWKRPHQWFTFAHKLVLLTFMPMCLSPLGKNPIFQQFFHLRVQPNRVGVPERIFHQGRLLALHPQIKYAWNSQPGIIVASKAKSLLL